MWQRIQTVFLVIVVISLIVSILFPIWVLRETPEQHELYAFHYSSTNADGVKQPNYYPYCITAILFVASITISFIEITKFRDRLLQIKLGTLNSVLLAGGLISAVYFATSLAKSFANSTWDYGLGLWLPGVAVICNWFAMRFIKRDERLVRDSERLR